MKTEMDLLCNVRVSRLTASGETELIQKQHNVLTNFGREWHGRLLGALSYTASPPTPIETARPMYIGVGCGGLLQTDTRFSRRQAEVRAVTHLEDPVPISRSEDERVYLKRVYNMSTASTLTYPEPTRPTFVVDFIAGEIAFVGNATRTTAVTVGTNVPVSELGLYLSTASTRFSHVAGLTNEADPLSNNKMVAYCLISPTPVTPNAGLRIEWEFRV